MPGSGIISDSHATYTGVVSERRGGASKWMHQGVSGSNVLMTDASGNVTDTRTFDAFGQLLGSSGNNPDPFRAFAGFGLFWEAQYGGYSSGGEFFDPGLGLSQNDGGSVNGRPGPPSHRLRPMTAAVDGEGAAFLPGGPVSRSPISDFQCKANGFSEWVDDWMFGGSAKRLGDTVQRYQMGTATGWELAYAITDFSVNMAANAMMIAGPISAGIARAFESGATRGGAESVLKGQRGVENMIAAKELEGYKLVGREITIKTKGGRFRIDAVMEDPSKNLHFFDNKAGSGKPTGNQISRWEEFGLFGGRGVGNNAKAAGLRRKLLPGKVVVEKYPY
ncbi:MAG: hypothetical protein U0R49_00185 [Fimbriimonadales bacterium]